MIVSDISAGTFEGKWDDILTQSHLLSGRRVRVVVLDAPLNTPPPTLDASGEAEQAINWTETDDTIFAELEKLLKSRPITLRRIEIV